MKDETKQAGFCPAWFKKYLTDFLSLALPHKVEPTSLKKFLFYDLSLFK